MKKVAIICLQGLDNFLDWTDELNKDPNFIVNKYIVQSGQDIDAALQWCDIAWFEWCNESAVIGTDKVSKIREEHAVKAVVRLHSYEALAHYPHQVKWNVVDRLVFVAPHIQAIVEEAFPGLIDDVQKKVIYNGVDLDNIPFQNPGDGKEIAVVAGISHKKNPALALQIMYELGSDYTLHWAGGFQELRYELYLKHMVKEMKIENNVKFYGQLSKSEMEDFWHGKNIILSTSVHEGHPYNLMEGMARGLTPIIHNFFGAKNLFREPMDGNIFNTLDDISDIFDFSMFPAPKEYRNYLIDHGWTLKNQTAEIAKLLSEL